MITSTGIESISPTTSRRDWSSSDALFMRQTHINVEFTEEGLWRNQAVRFVMMKMDKEKEKRRRERKTIYIWGSVLCGFWASGTQHI
ncbi:hypothetical protein ACN38_g2227 [Penicillium nordicum]|uniref:Uncharacterized protein n=1 Tax=Penicillium nordicum TaxID=229535 RepID=A0A0M8PAA0_9EURO|nr:hypothetical protein ACN38_g2227 [Penicillium nordicum]